MQYTLPGVHQIGTDTYEIPPSESQIQAGQYERSTERLLVCLTPTEKRYLRAASASTGKRMGVLLKELSMNDIIGQQESKAI